MTESDHRKIMSNENISENQGKQVAINELMEQGKRKENLTSDEITAMIDEGQSAGEPGPYGRYVKTVNGITLDYDTDGKYWAFYVDGEYGITGVDETDIVPGSTYMFKPE